MTSKATLAINWPVYRPRGWGIPSKSRPLPGPWYGLDTERDAKTGKFVCGWTVGEDIRGFKTFLDLIPGTYWVWNLNYDIEGMLRDLRIDEGWAAKADGASFPLLGGDALYYHGKRFDLKIEKKTWHFIEASSFFGRQPLANVGAKDKGVKASEMSLERYLADGEYRQKVDYYCQQDSRIVYERMIQLRDSLANLGVTIGATPGATARRYMAKLGKFPDVIWRTHKSFLRSYCGGRFEITKRGVLHGVKQYDIVSAYPWALSQCPWLTETATSHLTRRVSDNALYGSYEVSFDMDSYLGLAPRLRDGIRIYSKREDSTWLTKPEVDWLRAKGVDVHIWRGVEVFDENATNLWAQVITELFTLKQKGKKEPDGGWGAKIILNSEYGILIQLVRRSGKWVRLSDAVNPVDFAGTLAYEEPPKEFESGKCYAPLYAGNLTALTRLRLLDAAEDTGYDNYIGGHTDSVHTLGRLTRGIGNGLGDWGLEKEAETAYFCKTGMYSMDNKVKFRGIDRQGTPSQLWDDTHNRKTRTGIKRAASWDEVSVILPKIVANNYTVENKRKWHGEVTRGLIAMERFIDSEALANVG